MAICCLLVSFGDDAVPGANTKKPCKIKAVSGQSIEPDVAVKSLCQVQ